MTPHRRLTLVLLAVVAAAGLRAASAATTPAIQPVTAEEMSLGNPKAKVTVVEYGSAACPHCARFNNEVFQSFKQKYVDTGKVRYVFREFLTEPVPFAATAFMMARCAGDKKYFDVLNDVFQEQAAIYQSGDLPGGLLKIGAKYGLDKDKLNACTDDKAVEALKGRIQRDEKDGIEAVPTFVIGATKLDGEQTLDKLSAAIDPQLAK